MGTLLGIARFAVHDGKLAEFRRLARRCPEIVAEQGTGTVRYEVYLSPDERQAIVIEEYVDEAALRAHGEHLGAELSAAVLATGEVHGELLGELSDDLRAELRDGPVTAYAPAHL